MGNLLYAIAVILILIWAVSFLAHHITAGLIHILLVIAALAIILRVMEGSKPL